MNRWEDFWKCKDNKERFYEWKINLKEYVKKEYIKPDSKTLDEYGFEIMCENDQYILYKIDLEEVELKEEVKKKWEF